MSTLSKSISDYVGKGFNKDLDNQWSRKMSKEEGVKRRSPFDSPPSSTRAATVCTFCKSNGEDEGFVRSHTLRDQNNKVTCPVLQRYTCPICGLKGEHTRSYCPALRSGSKRRSPNQRTKQVKPQGMSLENVNLTQINQSERWETFNDQQKFNYISDAYTSWMAAWARVEAMPNVYCKGCMYQNLAQAMMQDALQLANLRLD